ncbi:MAG: DUF6624 domain-containing protein [Cyclobacteriaceae bacterium]
MHKLALIFTLLIAACSPAKESSMAPNYDSLRIVLEGMVSEEQKVRKMLMDSGGFNSPGAGPIIAKMMEIDERNQAQLNLILEKYGWIGSSKIGEEAAGAFFFIIQHSNEEMMSKWFPTLDSLSKLGEANPRYAAMMEDRLLMWQGKKQIYGTQASDFRSDKQMAIWPIENPGGVNERRTKIGFSSTVEEYAASMGVIYDPNDTLPAERD